MKLGVLALQGACNSHVAIFDDLGVTSIEVRCLEEFAGVDALVLPGGESTAISMLLDSLGLWIPIVERLADGLPVLGTCAGMILLATEVVDGRNDQRSFGAVNLRVRRNGYGRQVDSFETDIEVLGLERPFHGIFIRAPIVEKVGPEVKVLASADGMPVFCQQDNVFVTSFHPELTNDTRLHELFLEQVAGKI